MHFARTEIKRRAVAPRIFIYVALLLIAAWWINRLEKGRQNVTTPQPPSSAEILSSAGAEDSQLPLVVVLSLPDEALREVVAEARQRFSAVCRIVLLTTGTDDAGVKEVFQVGELPAALLFDQDNRELGRRQGAITCELLAELVEASSMTECPQEVPSDTIR